LDRNRIKLSDSRMINGSGWYVFSCGFLVVRFMFLFVPPLTSLEMCSYHLSSPSQPRHMHSTTEIEDSSGKGVCIRAVVKQKTNERC
jgi:hypothetical protein